MMQFLFTIFAIVQFLLRLFICDTNTLYNVWTKYIVHKLQYQNLFFLTQKQLDIQYTHQQNRIVYNYDYKTDMNVMRNNVQIPLHYHQKYDHLIMKRRTTNKKWGIRLENDSAYILHLLYRNKKTSYYSIYNQIVNFFQIGIQHVLSNNTITIGTGKRYIFNKKYGIGYNTILNLPILNNQSMGLPYSVNIGGEYCYNNLVVALNGYYNLNQILDFHKSYNTNLVMFPTIGYQIYIQSILPYISECKSHIKLEKCFYHHNNNHDRLSNNNDVYILSLGIGYKPISILDIIIENIFFNKKYADTLFKIALQYQFRVPIAYQIKQKHDKNKLLHLNYLNSVLIPFLPDMRCVKIHNNHNYQNKPHSIYKVSGYSKEIKYIKINHSDKVLLKWYTEPLEEIGGKIVHIENNLYKIYFPEYSDSRNNHICCYYEEQNDTNFVINNQHKILISVEKFTDSLQTNNTISNNNLNLTQNTQEFDNNSNSVDLSIHEKSNQNSNLTDYLNNELDNTTKEITNDDTTTSCTTSKTMQDVDNDNLFTVPIPPPIPELLCFSPAVRTMSQSYMDLSNNDKKACLSSDQKNTNQQTISNIESNSSETQRAYSSVQSSHCDNTQDLFNQLLMQKQTKFSATGTSEYITQLEQNIMERKKLRRSSDMEKIFNKLHKSISCTSSIDDVQDIDDDNDCFSESSFNKN